MAISHQARVLLDSGIGAPGSVLGGNGEDRCLRRIEMQRKRDRRKILQIELPVCNDSPTNFADALHDT
jgi:hypothetical protein